LAFSATSRNNVLCTDWARFGFEWVVADPYRGPNGIRLPLACWPSTCPPLSPSGEAVHLSTSSSKTERQSRIQEIIRPYPSPNSRQHGRALNWRKRRIPTRNPGVRVKPRGFRLHSKPTINETENGRKSKKPQNIGFSASDAQTMPSTKLRLEIGTAERWLPGMDSNHDSRLQRPLSYH
jgi:hypothetical protein